MTLAALTLLTLMSAVTYRILASTFSLPFCLFHESHLARPSISSSPGRGTVISPSVADYQPCLIKGPNAVAERTLLVERVEP
jgi:hypothetical protein